MFRAARPNIESFDCHIDVELLYSVTPFGEPCSKHFVALWRGFKSGHFPDARGTLSSMSESSMSDLLAARSNYRHADGTLMLSKHCHDFARGITQRLP